MLIGACDPMLVPDLRVQDGKVRFLVVGDWGTGGDTDDGHRQTSAVTVMWLCCDCDVAVLWMCCDCTGGDR